MSTKELALQAQKAKTIRGWLRESETVNQLKDALPSYLSGDRFLRIFYTAILRNPKLLDCSKASLLSALIQAGQLGLEPIMGKAALIPYGTQCQFQTMYRGLIDLARHTGHVKVTAHVVYENDKFERCFGLHEDLIHKPAEEDRGNMRGAYTVWTWPSSGIQSFTYMPKKEIEDIRDKYSKSWKNSGKNSIWGTAPGEMWKKTVIIRHSKLEPCSPEMERATHDIDMTKMNIAQLPDFDWLVDDKKLPQTEQPETDDLFHKTFLFHKHESTVAKITEGVTALAKKFEVSEEEIKKTALDDPDAFRAEIKSPETTTPPSTTTDSVSETSGTQNEEETPPDAQGTTGEPSPREKAIISAKEMLDNTPSEHRNKFWTDFRKTKQFEEMPLDDQSIVRDYYDNLLKK